MNKKKLICAMLALCLLLSLAACGKSEAKADPKELLQGIYDAMLAENSAYTEIKNTYVEALPGVSFTETLGEDRITVSAEGNEYAEGSWDFVLDGDYLTTEGSSDNFLGLMLASAMAGVVGDYLGMDPDLMQGYLRGLGALSIESSDLTLEHDEAAGTYTYRYKVTGPYEMKELDQMVVDERLLADYEPFDDSDSSVSFSIGKVLLLCSGSKEDCFFLLREFGELDEAAMTSLQNAVAYFQPEGYEDFAASYTSLAEAETAQYTATLTPDEALLSEYGLEQTEKTSYVLVRFGG